MQKAGGGVPSAFLFFNSCIFCDPCHNDLFYCQAILKNHASNKIPK